MTTLRRKVIVWVSAIVVTLALLGLPGCKKDSGTAGKTPAKTPAKKTKELPE
jgi:hypothetical protein